MNHNIYTNSYFWHNHSQQEIDLIEERNGILYAFEFKWNENKKVKIPNQLKEDYPNQEYQQINPKNFYHFITNNNESN